MSRRAWSVEEIDRMVPPLAENVSKHQAKSNTSYSSAGLGGSPPVPLTRHDQEVWTGQRCRRKDDGSVDRSTTLYWIACGVARSLLEHSLPDHTKLGIIADAIAERDTRLGYEKFAGRDDSSARYFETAQSAFTDVTASAKTAPRPPAPPEEPRPSSEGGDQGDDELPPELELTDIGNALRFAKRFGGRLIYSPTLGGYAYYKGGRYVRDELGKRFELAKAVPKEFVDEAVRLANFGDQDGAKRLSKHGIASASRPRLESMVALAHSDRRVAVPSEDLDRDPYLLNVKNGTIDLRTGELREHRQSDRLTKISPVAYDQDAGTPQWDEFLAEILPDEQLRVWLKRWFGWCLTGVVTEEMLPIFYGTGQNGKSTFVNVLLAVICEYGQQAPKDLLMVKRHEHPTELAGLYGMRLVASVEIEEGMRLNESLVKQLTGRERVRARYMRQDFFEFDPTHKLLIVANHKPTIIGTDTGMWRRLKVVPFEVSIPESKQDKQLEQKLRAELPGILRWGIEGCLEWQRDGLPAPPKIKDASEEYRSEQDAVGQFLEECCIIVDDDAIYTTMASLFDVYSEWCKRSRETALKKRAFGDRLAERGFPPDKGPRNKPVRRHITLRDDAPRPDGNGPRSRLLDAPQEPDSYSDSSEGNTENSCKAHEKVNGVTFGYPNSGMNGNQKPSREGYTETTVTQGNKVTPSDELTDVEAVEVEHLVDTGMKRAFAVEAVLGEDRAEGLEELATKLEEEE
jgi:P4 family phage/plasmid primase-like protien